MKNLYEITLESKSLGEYNETEQQTFLPQMMAPAVRAVLQNELTPRQRECVYLVYFKNMSQRKAARLLGLSQPTVQRHLQKGLKKMHTILSYCADTAQKSEAYYKKFFEI